MRAVWLLVACVGCSYNSPTNGANGADGPIPPFEGGDPACMTWTFIPNEVTPCSAPSPDALELTANSSLNSDTGMLDGVQLPYAKVGTVGVVSVSSLQVPLGAVLRGIGTAPLAIMVWGDADIAGTIEVASTILGGPGAGAGSGCADANRGLPGTARSGGGGGGSFAADGGDGGDGNGGSGGNGAIPRAVPNKIAGGCEGADAGGTGANGKKGLGGGGIALIVKGELRIGGLVHAGGAGGTGGNTNDNGGGGGGSGGMIKLEAADLVILASATLAANGGQGGGGCQGSKAGDGANGTPNASEPTIANSEGGGTDGGGGGFLVRPVGNFADDAGKGGGGGGGGVGYIIFKGHTSIDVRAATMSPAGEAF